MEIKYVSRAALETSLEEESEAGVGGGACGPHDAAWGFKVFS